MLLRDRQSRPPLHHYFLPSGSWHGTADMEYWLDLLPAKVRETSYPKSCAENYLMAFEFFQKRTVVSVHGSVQQSRDILDWMLRTTQPPLQGKNPVYCLDQILKVESVLYEAAAENNRLTLLSAA